MGTRLWKGTKKVFHGLGLVQNFVLLTVFFFFLFGPLALVVRLFGRDLLDIRHPDRESFWKPRPPERPTLERARHQS